ncbi:MAG: hypothetical protein ACLP1D_25815 [Xanthobacteraceae bacterium]
MTFNPDPEDAYFQDIQKRVARSIIGAMFGVAASVDQPQVGMVPLDHQHKHIAMLAELKFKTALRDLSRHTGGKLFDKSINDLWDLLASGIGTQRGLEGLERPVRKTANPHFRAFAQTVASSNYLNAERKLALWSGGRIISDYATKLGYRCLEATAIGGLLDLIKIYRNDRSLWSLWDYLAKEFCAQLEESGGEVHAFVRTFDNKASLFETEYPSLLSVARDRPSVRVKVKFHVLVELNSSLFRNDDLAVVGADGKPHVFRSLGVHGLFRETRSLQPFTYEDPFKGYSAQKAFLESNRHDPKLDHEALQRTLATPFVRPL